MSRRLALAGIAAAAVAVVAVVLLWPRYPPEPPDSYATFRDAERSFRHPPGWRATRGADGMIVVCGPGGDVALLRGFGTARQAEEFTSRTARRLLGREADPPTRYDLDVPGAERSYLEDVEHIRRGEPRLRVSAAVAETGAGSTVVLAVRTPIADDSRDARMIAGSLRLER